MNRTFVLCFLALVLVPLAAVPSRAAPPDATAPPGPELVIGTKEAPPFAMQDKDGTWHGIAIDLWTRIADELHLRYRFQPVDLQALIDDTANHKLDAAVAAITVSAERDRKVDFTEPYYETGLGIAVPADAQMTWLPVLRSFISRGFAEALGGLVGVALLVGLIVWFFERRHNVHFGGPAHRGIGSSIWWSALTMTQSVVAAGEKVPATLPGRVVAVIWMTASVIVIAAFTAALTTQLTTKTLRGLVHGEADLRLVRVGAVQNSETITYLDGQQISHQDFPDVISGLRALRAGRIDAFVYDKPLLTWAVNQNFNGTLQVLNTSFDPQVYAIALPPDSTLRKPLNIAVLSAVESEWWHRTVFHYLGPD